jgi:hypothetical protein
MVMTRMKALLALAAIAVAVIAGLKMSLPPVGRPCAGCGYPPGQGHNDRCPRRHAPLPEGDDGEVECYMHPDDGHHYLLEGNRCLCGATDDSEVVGMPPAPTAQLQWSPADVWEVSGMRTYLYPTTDPGNAATLAGRWVGQYIELAPTSM